MDKFAQSAFHLGPCSTPTWEPMVIDEAVASIELELASVEPIPDGSRLLIGDVVHCAADPALFNGERFVFPATPSPDFPIHSLNESCYAIALPVA